MKSLPGAISSRLKHFRHCRIRLGRPVLGNAGSLITFRIGAEDAGVLAPELGIASPSALCDLPNYQAWARLIRDGNPTDPFLLATGYPEFCTGHAAAVISRTRARYTRPRAQVEAGIDRFLSHPRPLS